MQTVTVRPAKPHEYEAAGEVTACAYIHGGHISAENEFYLPVLRDAAGRADKAELLVAVEGETVVGTATLARYGGGFSELAQPGEVELRMVAVHPAAAGRGIGSALVQAAIVRAKSEQCRRIVLCSQESMTRAHGLYRGFGFERDPGRDWKPVPDVQLLVFALQLA